MSVTFGFYNSRNEDRRYDALQVSSIFDGIIRDGVYQHIGTALMIKASQGMTVNVGIGRAWFNHTWTLNDALLPLTLPTSELILNRIDAVVVEVDSRDSVRANDIKIVKGTPSSNPARPTMVKTSEVWQYPLAYIQVNAGVKVINQANITNSVGTAETPFVTAPLEKMSIDALVAQWSDQWRVWFDDLKTDTTKKSDEMAAWIAGFKEILYTNFTDWYNSFISSNNQIMVDWVNSFVFSSENDFNTWFNNLQSTLDNNQATNLFNMIDSHSKQSVNSIDGVHNFRLWNNKFEYFNGIKWVLISEQERGLSCAYIDNLDWVCQEWDFKDYTCKIFENLSEGEI